MKLHELPLGPCVCGHPASWHGDRAVGFCIRFDCNPTHVQSEYRGDNGEYVIFPAFPRCDTCSGYQEDLHALYLEVSGGLASRRHMCRVAGVALG